MPLNIRKRRLERGITQISLARNINENQQTVSMWEKGNNTPRADKLPKLAAALKCSIDDLFTEDPEK